LNSFMLVDWFRRSLLHLLQRWKVLRFDTSFLKQAVFQCIIIHGFVEVLVI
jgi:hypothetical protein